MNPKEFTRLTLALIMLTSLSLGTGLDSVQAKPKQSQKEAPVKKQSWHNKKAKHSSKPNSQQAQRQEDKPESNTGNRNKGEKKGPPTWAPAWGYRCQQEENIQYPGKCSPAQNSEAGQTDTPEDTDQPKGR